MNVLDRFRLDGQRALVTGSSRGLGRVMALALADAGADVVLTGRTEQTLVQTADEVRSRGRQAITVVADMAQARATLVAADRLLAAEFGLKHTTIQIEDQAIRQSDGHDQRL